MSGIDRRSRFTVPTIQTIGGTLARRLIPVADRMRDLPVRFGLRVYRVRIVLVRSSSGSRGVGVERVVEEREILPVPLVEGLDGITDDLEEVGRLQQGQIIVRGISGEYEEWWLQGRPDSEQQVPDGLAVFYEVEHVQTRRKRRYVIASVPAWKADGLEWVVTLEAAANERTRRGWV